MKRLKDLKAAGWKMLRMAKNTLELAIEYGLTVAMICLLCVAVLKLPEMQNKWTRATVGSKVYMVRDSEQSGGGTGFAVKAPSGQSYIMTNDHVCAVSKDGRTVLISGSEGSMRRNIISHDENSDLCLIEGMPGVEGLELAWLPPTAGDTITIVGHPLLMPLHVEKGEMMSVTDVSVMMGPISVINPRTGQSEQIPVEEGGILPEQCSMKKNKQIVVDVDLLFFILKVKVCVLEVKGAYQTAVTGHPGNSGSPVVNFWGNVTGVLFAGDDETNWSYMVPLKDLKAFLKNY